MIRMLFASLLLGIALVGTALFLTPLDHIIDLPSLLVVLMLTISATICSTPFDVLHNGFQVLHNPQAKSDQQLVAGYVLFSRMGNTAITAGLIGSLIGLIMMLRNLDDPSTIGPAMAVAMTTSLYGVIIGELGCHSTAASLAIRCTTDLPQPFRQQKNSLYFSFFVLFVILVAFVVMLLSMANFN